MMIDLTYRRKTILVPLISNIEIRTEWLNESKAHEMSNNISWQEIDGDTIEYKLLSIYCSTVSVECPRLNEL